MFVPWHIPDPFIRLEKFSQQLDGYIFHLVSTKSFTHCPHCHCYTSKKHSTYMRYIQDLPSANMPVMIQLTAHKWRCLSSKCPKRIFTERFTWLESYARRTVRATDLLRHFAFSTSCLVGAKLAKAANLSVSHDTLLRIIYQTDVMPKMISPILGIDEFAWRKGHTYGTIICDFVTSRIVAVLPNRELGTVSNWLKQQPHIQMISRDGLLAFKEAIDTVNPNIIQISDRWHFIKNCKKRLDDLLLSMIPSSVERKKDDTPRQPLPLTKYEERALERKENKKKLIERVRTAYQSGQSMSQLAKQFQLNQRTIKKYITADVAWLDSPRRKKPHPFHDQIVQLEAERMTVKKIHATLVEQGFTGTYGATRMTVESIRKVRKAQINYEQPDLIKRPQISAALWKWPQQLTQVQKEWLAYLFEIYPALKVLYEIVQEFRKAVEAKDYPRFLTWLKQQLASRNQPFYAYSSRLRQDLKAVKHAFEYPYNNGFVEGHVNRLKTEKRRLYGRASVSLLEKRMLFHH